MSDSDLRYKHNVKAPSYVKNGVPEVWLLDIQDRQLEIYRESINNKCRQQDC